MKKIMAVAVALLMIVSILPMSVLAATFDTSVTGDYFSVISENRYKLAPGATETELVLNNSQGNDRKVAHYFEVDTTNENIQVIPGYYGIEDLDPNNLELKGVTDKSKYWKAEQLTKTVAYYESQGYNVVGAMNTALAYDSNAPYGYMVYNGVVLGTPDVHKGAQTYLAIDNEGNCELRSMTTPLNGNEVTAISANFGWLVQNGELVTKTVERTSSDASRSMIGIKKDGTLIFCQVDGRNAPTSSGLSNYEMGEMMLALGCYNAVNCDGGGSSTFVSKREGETVNTMRSVPSDGSERATINSAIIVSKAKATGEFDHAVLGTDYDYYAPGTSAAMKVTGVDAAGGIAEVPEEGITWALSDDSFGTVENGVFTSNGTKGDVTVQMLYKEEVVGERLIHIVDPDVFAFTLDETVLPYGKSMILDFACTYGLDNWAVCVDGAYDLTLSDTSAATLEGTTLTATIDESVSGVDVTATYKSNPDVKDVLKVTFGKGSEVIYDFENGDRNGFMGFVEAKQWSIDNGVNNTLVGDEPLAKQFNSQLSSTTSVTTTEEGGQVRNGNYALAWNIDNTDADFEGWSYNVLFNVGKTIVLRDVANGKNATSLGMWLYIPEGAAGLAFQSQFYVKNDNGTYTCKQDHFTFTTASGQVKNLNSCTEADIPESRWVYASIDISGYDYLCTPVATDDKNSRSPSFIRTYVKPKEPAVHTFYIDDITLDYSSAVDDRVLPTISDVSYTTSDESVALNEGATIKSNTIAFSAAIADNMKLDYTTGKIYVDGNALTNATASGKYLTSENVLLTAGVHTVTFEIKDALGNTAVVTRTFTVDGDPVITLNGHNDSGEPAEYDSIYYVDINTADISSINKLTTVLKLQNANTWEPQGIAVAEGFKASYELNEISGLLTVTVEKNGEDINTDTNTLVSIPVRIWSFDGVNNVTGQPMDRETYYKAGYCPVVAVNCKVLTGTVEFADDTYNGYLGAFGGKISVETKINDIVYPWHYHDSELKVLNKDATCTTDGYTGRTYCDTCKSVIDWGTVVSAKGHKYDTSGKCEICGKQTTYTGLYQDGDNWYYYVNGTAVSGWQMIDNDWYYFDPNTKIGANGDVKIDVITYNFENGKLTSGVWAKTLFGMRYYYGPSFYNNKGWHTIDGKDYFFENGMRLEGGYQLIFENNINRNWYYFNEDGSCDKTVKPDDGFYTDRNGYAYSKDGQGLSGIQKIDGKFYYFNQNGYAQKNGTYGGYLFKDDYAAYTGFIENNGTTYLYVNGKTATDGLYKIDGDYYYSTWGGVIKKDGRYHIESTFCDLSANKSYTFGKDGKMLNGVVETDGKLYLYKNGTTVTCGLYKIDGDYYYSNWGGALLTDGRYYVEETFCDLPANNSYTFGKDGKMLNGIVEIDDKLYLYKNGKTVTCGLYKIDGDYYYSTWGGLLQTDGKYYAEATYCDLPANNSYTFGKDGKMLNGVVDVNGTLYLYKNGKTVTCGLYKIDGDYYYSTWGGLLQTDGKYYAEATFCDLPANNSYTFGKDGKMLNGVVDVNGTLYLYKNGKTVTCGLYNIDGDYYYSTWGGLLQTDGKYYAEATFCDLPANNSYTFGKDGKMLDGIVDVNGTLYLYKKGKTVTCGLYKIDGDYYYSTWGGLLQTDGRYYAEATFCDLSSGVNYTFGKDGKMIDGIVETDGKLYLYKNGNTVADGLYEIDGDYYYASNGGELQTGGRYYAVATFCNLPSGRSYTFGEDGKILDGFVTIDGTIYYYENGNTPSPGIIEVDGNYYFVSWDGVIITNRTYYVWEGNGYTIEKNYVFDETGKIVG